MQCEIDELKKELRRAWQRCSSPDSELSSEETGDATYRRRSRTLPSETFSCDKEYHHRHKNKSPTHKGLGNNSMNEVLSQVAKSPFTWSIEGASLPRRFHQPTFSLYNGWTDPMEHVSHFSQKMAVHSRDEALMCKIFLFLIMWKKKKKKKRKKKGNSKDHFMSYAYKTFSFLYQ